MHWRKRLATSCSSRSPASCPNESFTILKRSRSMNSTAQRRSWRCAVSIAWSSNSANSVRFGRPVSSSCVARILDARLGGLSRRDVLDDRYVVHEPVVGGAPG